MSQLRDANIIWLLSLLLLLLAIPHGQSDRSFNAYQLNQNTTAYIPLGQDPVVTPNLESILLTYEPTQTTSFGPGYESFVQQIVKWLSPSNIVSTIPSVDGGNYDDENKYGTRISTYEECKRFYGCLYYILLRSAAQDPEPSDDPSEPDVDLRVCVSELFNKTLACEIYISDVRYLAQDSCASRINTIDAERRWQMEAVDENLQVFMESGGDSRGIWWQGLKPVGEDYGNQPSFSSELGRQMIGDTSFQCSLASPCLPNLDCHTVGSHIAYALGKKPLAETWALYALTALKNINQQLSSQYIALKGVTIGPTLRTFSIKDFYPQPDKDFNLPNILRSLASAFALLGGFTPGVAGKALSQGSTTIGAVGAYLGRYIGDSAGTTIVQEQYADYVEQIYTSLMSGLDDVTAKLFNGSAIDGDFNILSMVRGGAWLDTSALQRASGLEDKLRIEILSRSINAVWKTPTSNKIFVTFVDLGDGVNSTTICKADTTGPAELKYCGDGGVYYLYNIIEDGEGVAHLSWPWGADKIWDKLKINPAVSSHSLASR